VTELTSLERRVPDLRGARRPLGRWPTPVRSLDVGGPAPLWVKDEGSSADAYGGNKIRKLEWLLPTVPAGAALITAGAVGSNHVVATSVHAGRAGIPVHAILVPQPDTPTARRNAAVTGRLAHRVWPAANEAAAVVSLGRAIAAATQEQGRRPRVVWIGGSTPRGILGWVDGALELAAQVARGELPEPTRIYVPAGSGGIAAGLLVGLRWAGLASTVHAVQVADPIWSNRRAVLGFARATVRELRRHGAPVPAVDPHRLRFDRRWFGDGYGAPSPAGDAAASLARDAGLSIEPTYSSKALAAAIEAARSGRTGGPVLWIDTANARPLEPLVGGELPPPPPELAALLEPLRHR
jgi:D-cysteine desulfhydrase